MTRSVLTDCRTAFVLFGGFALAAGCSGHAAPTNAAVPMLRVTERAWSGSSKVQGSPSVKHFEATPGRSLILGPPTSPVKLTTVGITRDRVAITVTNVARTNPGGGINLRFCGLQRYTLKLGETVKFATCMMDAGKSWTIERWS